jgi:hypothetical protein
VCFHTVPTLLSQDWQILHAKPDTPLPSPPAQTLETRILPIPISKLQMFFHLPKQSLPNTSTKLRERELTTAIRPLTVFKGATTKNVIEIHAYMFGRLYSRLAPKGGDEREIQLRKKLLMKAVAMIGRCYGHLLTTLSILVEAPAATTTTIGRSVLG